MFCLSLSWQDLACAQPSSFTRGAGQVPQPCRRWKAWQSHGSAPHCVLCPQTLFHLLLIFLNYLYQALSHQFNLLNCLSTNNTISYWTQSLLIDWKVRRSYECWVPPPQQHLKFKIIFLLGMNPKFRQGLAGHFIFSPLKLSEDMNCSYIHVCLVSGIGYLPTESFWSADQSAYKCLLHGVLASA